MGSEVRGRRRALGRSRVNTCDFLHLAQRIPACTQSRQINLARVAAARDTATIRISWPTLFVRALGMLAIRWPVLRQCYMRWPWAHVYQTQASVAMIAVQRQFRGESWLFFGRLHAPENSSLQTIEMEMTDFRTGPVEETFRVQWNQSGLPVLVRRAMAGFAYHVHASRRARHFGTFGLTTVGSRGATIDGPPLINSATFSYGPIDAEGRCRLTVAYDHRLIDGAPIAELLGDVETALGGAICAELSGLYDPSQAGDGGQSLAIAPSRIMSGRGR